MVPLLQKGSTLTKFWEIDEGLLLRACEQSTAADRQQRVFTEIWYPSTFALEKKQMIFVGTFREVDGSTNEKN